MKINGPTVKSVNPYQTMEKKNSVDFKDLLLEKLKEVDTKEKAAIEAIESLAKGEDIDPAEVAMRISQADNSMKLLLRIRNKVLEAYQEIMRMQI
ncbi:MAG: flagellar hook-basal body complex protein FliE [Caldimicrobium sp.]|nr:flagellar hook-basal body complex protein FliE [Caldimicrobium sp.]MCX7612627.1 flagellar hook-basal body complex protein FliE [Caldimicrobium sp.]MDW8182220.1 flagellar hook-basal body complex protein FliE [Caldimicrobium sp.]